MRKSSVILFTLAVSATGCGGALVQPGHRALLFDPGNGGIQHEVLQPGWYRLACPFWVPGTKCPRVDDFDVTYSTSKERFHALSKEGLPLDLDIAVVYRPIVSELYLLDTEMGPAYFDEIIGPEFHSAAIGVFAHTSYQDLQSKNGSIEDEIEKELRQRLHGKHVEISSVLIEQVEYDAEDPRSPARARRLAGGDAGREAARREQGGRREATGRAQDGRDPDARGAHQDGARRRRPSRRSSSSRPRRSRRSSRRRPSLEVKKIEIQKDADEEKFTHHVGARQQEGREAARDRAGRRSTSCKPRRTRATRVTQAKGEAAARLALAQADAAEKRATAANITKNQVMMHAYDALGKLGGSGTTFLLGDWSKLPNWLFPRMPGFQTAFPGYGWPAPAAGSGALGQNDATGNPYQR